MKESKYKIFQNPLKIFYCVMMNLSKQVSDMLLYFKHIFKFHLHPQNQLDC